MPRQRYISEEDFTDERFAPVNTRAFVLWIGMRVLADDRGVLPAQMNALERALPAIGTRPGLMLPPLLSAGVVRQYEAEGLVYWAIADFVRRNPIQRPSWRYPLPESLWDYVGWTPELQAIAKERRSYLARSGRRRRGTPIEQPKLDIGPAANGAVDEPKEPVVFEWSGQIMRLTKRHYDRWRADFAAIPDFKGALRACDEWLQIEFRDKPNGVWWHPARAYMAKRHQEWVARSRPAVAAPNSTAALVARITAKD